MMKIVAIKPDAAYFVWASLALTGPDLVPEKNILLEIKKNSIVSSRTIQKNNLPASIKNHPHFICIEDGFTLLPALIDAHVHLALNGKGFNRTRMLWNGRKALQVRIVNDLNEIISLGTGAVRDGGDCHGINLEAKKIVEDGKCLGPRIIATGKAVRKKGGYGSFLGLGYRQKSDIPLIVSKIRESGTDQLKIIVSGVVSFIEHGSVKGQLMPLNELRVLVSFARKQGLKVMAHASSAAAVDSAVEAGVDSIEHGYFIRSESLKLMAEKQIAWVPTIIPVAIQAREPLLGLRTPLEVDVINRTCEEQIAKLSSAHKLGVPLGVGTDSGAGGVRHAHNLIEEMLLYKSGSLDNRAILKAVTSTNAEILGLGKEIGAIRKGFKAALIAVRGNPLKDLKMLKNVAIHLLPGS